MMESVGEERDYRSSHTHELKGRQYDSHYRDDHWARFLWQREKAILNTICQEREFRLGHYLDFACGTGRVAEYCEPMAETSTGVDVSDSMLRVASEKLKRTQLIRVDLTRDTAFDDGQFDVITAFRFFANAQDDLRRDVMRELGRMVSGQGVVVFNNHHHQAAPYIRLQRFRCRVGRRTEYRVMSIEDMRHLAHDAGLHIEAVYPAGLVHLPGIALSQASQSRLEEAALRWKRLWPLAEDVIAVASRRQGGSVVG
jgi:SAM-dependent methyltransferase